MFYFCYWFVKLRFFVIFVNDRETLTTSFFVLSYIQEFLITWCCLPTEVFFLGVTSKNRFLLSFCKLSYELEISLGVLAGAKIERTVFVFGHTCKSSPYELLPVRRVLFFSLWLRKAKLRNFVSCASVREILRNCF